MHASKLKKQNKTKQQQKNFLQSIILLVNYCNKRAQTWSAARASIARKTAPEESPFFENQSKKNFST